MTAMQNVRILFAAALIFAALLSFAGNSASAAAHNLVVVESQWVTLGDITSDAGKAAGARIARAPAPGERTVLSTATIADVAAQHGVHWDPSGLRGIEILRASTLVPRTEIHDRLAAALSEVTGGLRMQPEITNNAFALHVPAGVAPVVEVQNMDYDPSRGTFTAVLLSLSDGGDMRRTAIRGRARQTVALPVLINPVPVGKVIGPGDVGWDEFRADRVRSDVAVDPVQLVGLSPRRPIRISEPIRITDIRAPILVARNSTVLMIVELPGMQITSVGRALSDAALGESIEIINSHSRTTVIGYVEANGVVRVPLLRNALAAAGAK